MPDLDAPRRDALALLVDARVAVQRRFGDSSAEQVDVVRNELLGGRVATVAVGEFKRGKSSLLGALLDDPDLFPHDVDIATSLVTSIEYGPVEQILAYRGGGATGAPTSITRAQLAEYVTERGNPRNAREVGLVRIAVPNRRLDSGLVFLDTPGAGGLNTDHTAVTYGALGGADVALFVLDALTPLTTHELSLLSDVARQAARVLVVVTKVDLVPDAETAVANARTKIQHVLGDEVSAAIPIVAVSSAAKLDWLRTGDAESLEVSNFAVLESHLWSLLSEQGGGLLVRRALGKLIRQLDERRAPLDAELLALTGSAEQIDSRASGLDRRQGELTELARPAAGWRRQLIDAFDGIRTAVDEELSDVVADITTRLEARLSGTGLADDAPRVLADLQREVVLAWSSAVRDVRRRIADLSDTVEATTGLRPNPALPREGALTAFETLGRREGDAKAAPGSGFAALEWLGDMLTYVTGDVSVFIVTRLAAFFGVRRATSKRRTAQFAEDVRDQYARAQRELRERLAEMLDVAEESLMQTFTDLIDADRRRLSTARDALEGARGDVHREQELREILAELSSLSERARAIVQRVSVADRAVSTA